MDLEEIQGEGRALARVPKVVFDRKPIKRLSKMSFKTEEIVKGAKGWIDALTVMIVHL